MTLILLRVELSRSKADITDRIFVRLTVTAKVLAMETLIATLLRIGFFSSGRR